MFTKQELRTIADARIDVLNETRLFAQQRVRNNTAHFDIFLSHSYLDRKEVNGLYIALTGLGYSVYVDWIIDPQLNRTNVSASTADTIRKRLHVSDTLFYATSKSSINSNWMPWELGYMDGKNHKCAVIEVKETANSTFNRREFVLVYTQAVKNPQASDIDIVDRNTHNRTPFKIWKR